MHMALLFIIKVLHSSPDGLPYDVQRMEYKQEEKTCIKVSLEKPPVGLCKIDVLKFNLDGFCFRIQELLND